MARARTRKQRVLVLLAADNEEPLLPLMDAIGRLADVTLVRTYPSPGIMREHANASVPAARRTEIACMAGLMDATLLSTLADEFLGTGFSTFSYLIHARALLVPLYTGHTPHGCTRAASSEAGLVSASVLPSPHDSPLAPPEANAGLVFVDGLPEQARGESSRNGGGVLFEEDACTPAYMVVPHGCMETVAACAGGEAVRRWSASLQTALDWGGFYSLLFARSGWRDLAHVAPFDGMVCAEVRAGGEEAAEGGRGGVAEL